MKRKELYIPVNIRRRKEIADGIGKEELLKITLLTGIGLGIGIFLFVLGGEIFSVLLPPVITGMGGAIFLRKDMTNQSVLDRIHHLMEYSRSQKTYLYKYHNIYEEGSLMNGKNKSGRKNPDSQ